MSLRPCIVLIMLFVATSMAAGVRPSGYFSSNMVLQQNSEVKLFGVADRGEKISVIVPWSKVVAGTTASSDGEWEVEIRTPAAGGPYTISLLGNDTVAFDNILIGEVWFASGQSNMEMKLGEIPLSDIKADNGTLSQIRFYNVPRCAVSLPSEYPVSGSGWHVCSAEDVKDLSAVAYYFSRKLQSELGVPIGVIVSSWGGTPAEAWMSEDVLRSDTLFDPIFRRWSEWSTHSGQDSIEYVSALCQWKADSAAGINRPKPEIPQSLYMTRRPHRKPSVLYNGMVAPFLKVKIKGVIWYQGTSNKEWHNEYEHLFRTLIASWRTAWRSEEMPFYYVQIAPYGYEFPEQGDGIREAQLKVMDVPNTGMVVTMDCGDPDNIHPSDKKTPGERLALWALANTYGCSLKSVSGPVLKSYSVENNGIRLYFDYAIEGLTSSDGKPLRNFFITDCSGRSYPAEVTIDNESLFVHSPLISDPCSVKYALGNVFDANFVNGEGLPASPFRTDFLRK